MARTELSKSGLLLTSETPVCELEKVPFLWEDKARLNQEQTARGRQQNLGGRTVRDLPSACNFEYLLFKSLAHVQLFSDPTDGTLPSSSIHGVCCYFLFQGIFPTQTGPTSFASPALAGRFSATVPPEKPTSLYCRSVNTHSVPNTLSASRKVNDDKTKICCHLWCPLTHSWDFLLTTFSP